MPTEEHSPAFRTVKTAVLALSEDDRRRLTGMYGAMQEPLKDPGVDFLAIIRAIAELDDKEHVRLARWVRRYVNRWGQVPVASSYAVNPKARRDSPT